MTLHLKLPSQNNNLSPRILVIGIGGTGGNIINSMINSGIEGVDFLNVNTDSQQLKHSKVEKTLQQDEQFNILAENYEEIKSFVLSKAL